jgi:hypothetical protein
MQGPQLRFRLAGQEKAERTSTNDHSSLMQPLHTSPREHAPPLEHF